MRALTRRQLVSLNLVAILLVAFGYFLFDYLPSWFTALLTFIIFGLGMVIIYQSYLALKGSDKD